MHVSLLHDIGLCIVTATVLAFAARWARQPLVLAYIAAGVLIGPVGLRRVTDPDAIRTLAEPFSPPLCSEWQADFPQSLRPLTKPNRLRSGHLP